MAFDFVTYMETVAVTLKDLLHTQAKPSFFKASSLANIEEFLQQQLKIKEKVLIIIDSPEGNFTDNDSDNVLDNQQYNFFVVQRVAQLDMAARSASIKSCQATAKKIVSKMFRDKASDASGITPKTDLRNLERGSISYISVGPLGDNYHGVSIMFSLLEAPGILFNENDWTTVP